MQLMSFGFQWFKFHRMENCPNLDLFFVSSILHEFDEYNPSWILPNLSVSYRFGTKKTKNIFQSIPIQNNNNITNTTKFKDYVGTQLPKIVSELKSIKEKIQDKVTTIKLSETISVLEKMKMGKSVSDNQVSSIMLSYELIKELKTKINGK